MSEDVAAAWANILRLLILQDMEFTCTPWEYDEKDKSFKTKIFLKPKEEG